MQHTDIEITLDAAIDSNSRLVISANDATGSIELDPLDPLGALLMANTDADSLTLCVRDFLQGDALYRIHAATLDGDGKSVRAHWTATDQDNGRMYTFTRAELGQPGQRIFIGATPSSRDVPVPQAFAPGPRIGFDAPGDPSPDPPGGGSQPT